MRWPVLVLLAACGDNLGEAPATVVRVANTPCERCELLISDECSNYVPPLDSAASSVEIVTDYASTEIAGVVQVQYASLQDTETPQRDFVLLDHGIAEVPALFGASDAPLYRVQPDGSVFDVDATRLTSADDTALHFTYVADSETVTEDHVFDQPRKLTVDTTGPVPCCSAGDPSEPGVVLAVLLIRLRRRRRVANKVATMSKSSDPS